MGVPARIILPEESGRTSQSKAAADVTVAIGEEGVDSLRTPKLTDLTVETLHTRMREG